MGRAAECDVQTTGDPTTSRCNSLVSLLKDREVYGELRVPKLSSFFLGDMFILKNELGKPRQRLIHVGDRYLLSQRDQKKPLIGIPCHQPV